MTKVGWYAIGKSTTLESNKSLQQNGYSVAFGELVALKIKTLQVAIMASSAL